MTHHWWRRGGYSVKSLPDSGYCVKKILGEHLVGLVDIAKGDGDGEEEELFPAYELTR